jgi:hypothetical protein
MRHTYMERDPQGDKIGLILVSLLAFSCLIATAQEAYRLITTKPVDYPQAIVVTFFPQDTPTPAPVIYSHIGR